MESATNSPYFIPQVAEDIKPILGQVFDSLENAHSFYKHYAKEAGISIRAEGSKRRSQTKEVYWKQYVCSKEGYTVLTGQKQNRGTMRMGCRARVNFKNIEGSSNWTISLLVEEHNHVLTSPSKKHLLTSHREVSNEKRNLAMQLAEANVSTAKQVAIMSVQAGGIENLGFTERDLRNVERDMREEQKGIDAETLFEFFLSEKDKDPGFFFAFEKDDNNRMKRCFWADSTSRSAYSYFGDVVVFDTTYSTNKYGLIFAPLVGVNHHSQTIIFGCGFLNNEKTESFLWLFDQWLSAMEANPPRMIITDQDAAITSAISQRFPNTFHRFCIWHIMKKFPEYMGSIKASKYFNLFKASVYNSETDEAFVYSWNNALDVACLWGNIWLESIFDIREKWVPVYTKDIFSAAMMSSQRAESGHSFLKKFVFRKNTLMDFVIRFGRELERDHRDINEIPQTIGVFPMEKQMVGIYTKKIFMKFQNQLVRSNSYTVKQLVEIEGVLDDIYTVEHVDNELGSKIRVVEFNVERGLATCTCPFFDFEGVPCRHILAYLRFKQDLYLPEIYILPRWVKSVKVGRRLWKSYPHFGSPNPLKSRHAKLLNEFGGVCLDAAFSEQTAEIFREGMKLLCQQIKNTISSSPVQQENLRTSNSPINDPKHVNHKGCHGRLKSRRELGYPVSASRSCHYCGAIGAGHNARGCPVRIKDELNESMEQGQEHAVEDDLGDISPQSNSQDEPLTPIQGYRGLSELYAEYRGSH